MESVIIEIEKKCHEKLLVFHDLLEIFRKERRSLINADISALWKYTREKQEKADEINGVRSDILEILNEAGIEHGGDGGSFSLSKIITSLPEKKRSGLINIRTALTHVKNEISAVNKENRMYIEESLSTIEDLMAILTGAKTTEEIYSRQRAVTQCGNSRTLLYREA